MLSSEPGHDFEGGRGHGEAWALSNRSPWAKEEEKPSGLEAAQDPQACCLGSRHEAGEGQCR
jgi:hypothetical protein